MSTSKKSNAVKAYSILSATEITTKNKEKNLLIDVIFDSKLYTTVIDSSRLERVAKLIKEVSDNSTSDERRIEIISEIIEKNLSSDEEILSSNIESMYSMNPSDNTIIEIDREKKSIFVNKDMLPEELTSFIFEILSSVSSKEAVKSLRNFIIKIYSNPNKSILKSLPKWLEMQMRLNGRISLSPNGDIYGYKGCGVYKGNIFSIHSGDASVLKVDGTIEDFKDSRIPNEVDTTVFMDPSSVDSNEKAGCSHGLHVGTFDYARGFSEGKILLVSFSPAHVVAVTEHDFRKIRTSMYRVISETSEPLKSFIYEKSDELEEEIRNLEIDGLVEEISESLKASKKGIILSKGKQKKEAPSIKLSINKSPRK